MTTASLIVRAVLLMAVIGIAGCSSTGEQTSGTPPPQEPVRPPLEFESHMDTVLTSRPAGHEQGDRGNGDRAIRYMVQIGAFADPVNASRVQELARERFRIPVFNDYHTGLRLYQVRIGFFEDRTAAVDFRSRLIAEYPDDYRDAWVVQLLR